MSIRKTVSTGRDPAEDGSEHTYQRREHGDVADGTNGAGDHVLTLLFIFFYLTKNLSAENMSSATRLGNLH